MENMDTEQLGGAQPPKKTGKILWLVLGATAFIIFCAVMVVGGIALIASFEKNDNNSINERSAIKDDGNKIVTPEEEDIASVVSKVGPSVVSIVTSSSGGNSWSMQAQVGAGTGIIVSEDGYILTNKHVVNGTSSVNVILSDGTTYEGVKVLGSDPLNDIAFLKIQNVKGLTAAKIGDSSSIRVGQKVVAIGNSLGQYQNTVTSGIISGTGRPIIAEAGDSYENLTDLLQTDAAINPGNSGGPLLNIAGQVIGVNTAIAQEAQGIGFAIPINATKGILKGVLAGKGVMRAYLGVNYLSITPEVAREYNLSVKRGAYVYNEGGTTAVIKGSPADKAGLKDKDIIVKVGDMEVGERSGVSSLVAEYAPGDVITLTILRDGRQQMLKVTLEAYRD